MNCNMKKIYIINGPNLNLLGKREPEKYGTESFEDFFTQLRSKFKSACELVYFQSNSEGALLDYLHEIGFREDTTGVVINAGAYTHTSVALADAIAAMPAKCIEVHITNTAQREAFRHQSYLSKVCVGTITGLGLKSYQLGVQYFVES